MYPKIITKKNRDLTKTEKATINKNRVKEFGEAEAKDFNRDYEPNTEWFFVEANGEIVSLGGLRPINLTHMGKTYDILGICSIISVVKGRRYGTALMAGMLSRAKKKGKTALGFTRQTEFFKKAGLGTEKDFIKRFIYKNLETGEEVVDEDGDGIYFNGEDDFINKVLETDSPVYINVLHW